MKLETSIDNWSIVGNGSLKESYFYDAYFKGFYSSTGVLTMYAYSYNSLLLSNCAWFSNSFIAFKQ